MTPSTSWDALHDWQSASYVNAKEQVLIWLQCPGKPRTNLAALIRSRQSFPVGTVGQAHAAQLDKTF
jgi:hypothetical protein